MRAMHLINPTNIKDDIAIYPKWKKTFFTQSGSFSWTKSRVARHVAFERPYFEREWLKSSVISLQLRENAIAGASIPSYPAMIAAKPIAQVKCPSNERALFNFASRARVTSRCTKRSDFDNPFRKESKHVPRGASSPTLSVGMIDKID